jgi:hypothetical protein
VVPLQVLAVGAVIWRVCSNANETPVVLGSKSIEYTSVFFNP